MLMNSFISVQFNNCPLVWMLNDRAGNAEIYSIFKKYYGCYAMAVNQSMENC